MLTVNSGKTNYYKIKLKKARKVKLTLKSMCTNYGNNSFYGGVQVTMKGKTVKLDRAAMKNGKKTLTITTKLKKGTNYIKVSGKDRANGGYTISWK